MDDESLDSKSSPILITGVGKRIGLFLANHLLEQGYSVAGTYRTRYPSLDRLEAAGAELFQCDFEDQQQLEGLIDNLRSRYRSLRALIHNASDWVPESSGMAPNAIIDKMMRVHVSAPYQFNLALSDALVAGNGDIIHLTDLVADKGSKKHIAYAASKAALSNLTASFAQALAPQVQVNSISPAMICFNVDDDETYREKTLQKALLPIEPGEQEILDAVLYLLKSRYVTGRTLYVDGGRHLK